MVMAMLNATISRDVLDAIVGPVMTLDSDQLLQVEPDGIKIHATDKSRAAIIDVWAPDKIFESYCADSMEAGIDLSNVAAFLDIVDGTEQIQIRIDDEQGRITLIADSLSYTVSFLATDDIPQALSPLDTEQPASATIQNQKLNVPIELANIAGSNVQLSVHPDPTTFSGTTDGVRDLLFFELDATDVKQSQESSPGLTVPLDYFLPIQRTIPDDALVRFELGNRKHVQLQYPLSNGAGTMTITFAGVV